MGIVPGSFIFLLCWLGISLGARHSLRPGRLSCLTGSDLRHVYVWYRRSRHAFAWAVQFLWKGINRGPSGLRAIRHNEEKGGCNLRRLLTALDASTL